MLIFILNLNVFWPEDVSAHERKHSVIVLNVLDRINEFLQGIQPKFVNQSF